MFCGHLYSEPYEKWLPERFSLLSKNSVEFEAETVCWLVCERLGIKNPSAEYLRDYLENNNEIPNISVDAIMKAAGIVESFMIGTKTCRKELKIEKPVK